MAPSGRVFKVENDQERTGCRVGREKEVRTRHTMWYVCVYVFTRVRSSLLFLLVLIVQTLCACVGICMVHSERCVCVCVDVDSNVCACVFIRDQRTARVPTKDKPYRGAFSALDSSARITMITFTALVCSRPTPGTTTPRPFKNT